MQQSEILEKKHTIIYLSFLVVVGLGIRLYYFPYDVPIATDGYYSFVYSIKTVFDGSLAIGYDTTNSGWSNFLSLVFYFFDKSDPLYLMEIQRISSIMFSCLTIIPGFFIFKRFTNTKIALVGSLILAVEPRLLLNSLEGINFSMFFFLFVLSTALFLNRKKMTTYLAFVCVSLLSLTRYEGILLFIPFTIIFLRNSTKKEIIFKVFMITLIITTIIIPISFLRMDATIENCYEILNKEICGKDGILNSFFDRTSSMNDKIQGIPDLDDEIYYDNNNMIEKFVFYSIANFIKFSALLLIPIFIFFFILTIISIKKNNFLKERLDLLILFFITFVMIIPSFYAYGRDISEIRYVLMIIPLAITFSTFGINYFSNIGKNKKIIIPILSLIIILSFIHIEENQRDSKHDYESFIVSQKVIQLTESTNTFKSNGYIKTAILFSDWPNLPDIKDNGKLIQNFTTVSTKGYDDFTDFLEDTKNSGLEYIVVEDRSTIFESINKNEKEYTYLEKVFDSKELDLKNMFKIYKINYQKLGEM